MKILHLIFISFLFYLLGCVTSGRKIDPEAARQLKKGMSITQVEQLMGSPENIATAEGGKTYYQYSYTSGSSIYGFSKGKMQMINLTFTDSKLTNIDNKTTHTSGFFGNLKTKIETVDYSNTNSTESDEGKVVTPSSSNFDTRSNISYRDKKAKLLDMYINNNITEQQYSELLKKLDKNKKLIDLYLNKEISKEEYFRLRKKIED